VLPVRIFNLRRYVVSDERLSSPISDFLAVKPGYPGRFYYRYPNFSLENLSSEGLAGSNWEFGESVGQDVCSTTGNVDDHVFNNRKESMSNSVVPTMNILASIP